MVWESGQAGETECDEIKVTPEMIEAGVAELCHYNPDFEDEASAVTRIYHAMRLAFETKESHTPSLIRRFSL